MARRSTICTLVFVFSLSQLASALRVTPNSPCSSICRDSDANSSTTKNSDISCSDADYSSAAGTKFKNCMTCLQNSTFSQGGESDTMWFLYNLRYTVSYCVWAFPNATGIASTPCITSRACGPLEASIEDGIPNPTNTTAYSYCSSTGQGEAMNAANFANCIACISAGATTGYLANYFVALQAGCQQQPAPGVRLGLNDTVFSDNQISIVGPATNKDDRSSSKPSLSTPAIVGVVAGALVLILVVSGALFVCLRKRRNRRARTSAEADFYSRFGQRHHSDMSFQCQTHMVSPRFWPGADEGVSIPTVEREYAQTHRSSIWKPPQDSFQAGQQTSYSDQPDGSTAYISKKAALAAVPLHQITTTVPPTAPPQAYTSPSSGGGGIVYASPSDFKSPLSADSIRSSTALLPTTIKPYVPAEHGIHTTTSSPSPTLAPASASAFNNSPTSVTGAGTGMTPLLNSQTWWPEQQQQQQQTRPSPPQEHIIKLSNPVAAAPPPPRPPPLKTSRNSGMLLGRKSPKNVGAGSPVESREIRTSFPAPPKR